jgi:hypothetical protein
MTEFETKALNVLLDIKAGIDRLEQHLVQLNKTIDHIDGFEQRMLDRQAKLQRMFRP